MRRKSQCDGIAVFLKERDISIGLRSRKRHEQRNKYAGYVESHIIKKPDERNPSLSSGILACTTYNISKLIRPVPKKSLKKNSGTNRFQIFDMHSINIFIDVKYASH